MGKVPKFPSSGSHWASMYTLELARAPPRTTVRRPGDGKNIEGRRYILSHSWNLTTQWSWLWFPKLSSSPGGLLAAYSVATIVPQLWPNTWNPVLVFKSSLWLWLLLSWLFFYYQQSLSVIIILGPFKVQLCHKGWNLLWIVVKGEQMAENVFCFL